MERVMFSNTCTPRDPSPCSWQVLEGGYTHANHSNMMAAQDKTKEQARIHVFLIKGHVYMCIHVFICTCTSFVALAKKHIIVVKCTW